MEVWIIVDGEKQGPFQDWDIRGRIGRGELAGDTPAWHQGMDEWTPLARTTAFGDDCLMRETVVRVQAVEDKVPPPLPQEMVLGRRFWARWVDIHAYLAVWWLGMWAFARPIDAALGSLTLALVQLLPWFLLEAALVSRFGATPGKWLLGLTVANADGSRLAPGASLRRALRVMITGIGFGLGPLALFCQVFSLVMARRLGRPLWDHAGNHFVRASGISPLRIIAVVVALFCSLQLQMAVIGPVIMKDLAKQFPALREVFEKSPPWTLPQRGAPE